MEAEGVHRVPGSPGSPINAGHVGHEVTRRMLCRDPQETHKTSPPVERGATSNRPDRAALSGSRTVRSDTPLPGYWVDDPALLVGPYPGAPTKTEAGGKLEALLDAGVSYFLDLTAERESPPADGLIPYTQLLRQVAAKRGRSVTHHRIPLPVAAVPKPWEMAVVLGAIDVALHSGETVYLHDRGGVGRTGLVIGSLTSPAACRPNWLTRGLPAAVHTESPPTVASVRSAARVCARLEHTGQVTELRPRRPGHRGSLSCARCCSIRR